NMEHSLETAYPLKSMMESVFGRKAWLDLKHCQDLGIWKKYSKRLISAVEVSIKSTVKVADDDWFDELSLEFEHGKKCIDSAGSLDVLFANLAACLANISFLQIGMIPQRHSENNVAARQGESWNLSAFRTVQYVQTQEQKERIMRRKSQNSETST
ncbi:TPA: hypothetical protein ACX3GK_004562, partial [Vibrio parahaemolyticus]|nr:hypothetical protein [Vibrio parahaemolyticus]HCG7325692.1 hypothetical protein [Vibrio parahaemolyticus]HCG7943833.1 hypothetical protein [Vibrio parahaemolyticus]HCG8106713.1 hypothetical protein [Vibrio parahaemolyticus]